MTNNQPVQEKRPWYVSVPTTFILSFIPPFAFMRASDTSWEHTLWVSLGVATIATIIHRMVLVFGWAEKQEKSQRNR